MVSFTVSTYCLEKDRLSLAISGTVTNSKTRARMRCMSENGEYFWEDGRREGRSPDGPRCWRVAESAPREIWRSGSAVREAQPVRTARASRPLAYPGEWSAVHAQAAAVQPVPRCLRMGAEWWANTRLQKWMNSVNIYVQNSIVHDLACHSNEC